MNDRSEQTTGGMSSSERWLCLKRGERPDRVPIMAFAGPYAAACAGVPLESYYTDLDVCIAVQRQAKELHGYDDGSHYGWAEWGAWEFGGSVRFPKSYNDAAPRTLRHPVNVVADIDRLPIPVPGTAGMMPLLATFNRKVRKRGEQARIQAGSPTLLVTAILGIDTLMRWLVREVTAVEALYAKVTEFLIAEARVTVEEFGAANCAAGFSAAMDANALISPKMFHRFVVPCLQRINHALMEMGVDDFHLHLCGDHRHNLPLWADLPWPQPMTISIGRDMELDVTAETFGHRHIIAGNLDTGILARGSCEEVVTETRRALNEGMELPGGFVLMSGCEMPVLARPRNVDAMVATALRYGRYFYPSPTIPRDKG